MTHSENYWKLYLDSKKNSEPVSVSFNEKDNSVSLMATRRLVDILTASGVLDGETHLLNPAYKSMSDDELRCQLNEVLYTNTGKKLPYMTDDGHLTYEEYDQARNLVKFLQITDGNRLSIKTKLEVRYDKTLSKTVDSFRSNAWRSAVKEGPKLKEFPDILAYYIKLDSYYSIRRCCMIKNGHCCWF